MGNTEKTRMKDLKRIFDEKQKQIIFKGSL